MHGQYVKDMTGVNWGKTWQWLQKRDLEGSTEAPVDLPFTRTGFKN